MSLARKLRGITFCVALGVSFESDLSYGYQIEHELDVIHKSSVLLDVCSPIQSQSPSYDVAL